MPLDLPENITVAGTIEVAQVLKDDGDTGISMGLDGISRETAIGLLTAALERLKEEARFGWDVCPDCGRPWAEHDEEDRP